MVPRRRIAHIVHGGLAGVSLVAPMITHRRLFARNLEEKMAGWNTNFN
jgi:hypothetical protein